MTLEIVNLWPNPISISYLYDIDNSAIRKYCLDYRKNKPGRTISNMGGYQSLDLEREPPISNLMDRIFLSVHEYKNLLGMEEHLNFQIGNVWFNINYKGDFNVPHVHQKSIFSGVYYVDTVSEDFSSIVFINPNISIENYWQTSWFKHSSSDYCGTLNKIYPESNKLIIFPGWLQHYVEPSKTNKPRISISFNVGLY